MKKHLAILAVTALAVSAFAQGTINVQNQSGLVKQWTATDNTALISVAKSSGYVQVFAASAGTPLASPLFTAIPAGVTTTYSSMSGWLAANPGWSAAVNGSGAAAGLIGAAAGIFNDGVYTIPSTTLGVAANAEYILVGWSTPSTLNSQMTFNQMIAGPAGVFAGMSAIFTTTTTDPAGTATPPQLKLTYTGQTLAPLLVPEPTSFALAGLGLAAMLVLRRRK